MDNLIYQFSKLNLIEKPTYFTDSLQIEKHFTFVLILEEI